MVNRKLKASHFLLVIVSALVVSIFVPILLVPGEEAFLLGILTAVLALVSSLPFTIVFLLILRNWLNKDIPKSKFHLSVFLTHLIGSIITLLFFFIINYDFMGLGSEEFGILTMIVSAFFVYDTIGFYLLIENRYQSLIDADVDILDDSMSVKKEVEL